MPSKVIKIRIKTTRKRQRPKQKLSTATIFLLVLFPIFSYLAVINILTVFCFWLDKSYAIAGTWRISESKLHVLEALGGWPASFIAQQWFRHKLWKREYQQVFWVIFWALWLSWIGLWVWRSFGAERDRESVKAEDIGWSWQKALTLFGAGRDRESVKAEDIGWNWQRVWAGIVRGSFSSVGVAYGRF